MLGCVNDTIKSCFNNDHAQRLITFINLVCKEKMFLLDNCQGDFGTWLFYSCREITWISL